MNNRTIIEELRERLIETRHWGSNNISLSNSSVSCYFGECIRCSDHSSNMVGVGAMLNVTSDKLGDVNVWDYEHNLNELVEKLVEFDRLFWDEEYMEEQGIDFDEAQDKIDHLKEKIWN